MHTRRRFLGTSLAAASAALTGIRAAQNPSDDPAGSITFVSLGQSRYAKTREIYNGAITTQPKLIACCTSEAGVQQAIQRAVDEKLGVAVKSGGHCFEGFCLNDDGLVVDVSRFRQLHLDSATGILTAGAGCRLAEVNQFLLGKDRFLPAGSCEAVGLSGLTLGGGYGMFARKWGLTCDHLLSVRMVDGSGKSRDSRDEPDLLWACQGGGNGHFGVITEMTFKTRAAPGAFSAWKFRAYKLDEKRATALLGTWFDATHELPNDCFSAWVMNGSQVTILITTIGSRDAKKLVSARLKLAGMTTRNTSGGPTSLAKAMPWYYANEGPISFKNSSAGYYRGMDDVRAALPGVIEQVLKTPGVIFQVNTLGGAIADGTAGAYPHRAFPYLGEQQAYWEHPSQAERCVAAAAKIRDCLAEAGIARHYANYPDVAFKNWSTSYYGDENYRRLQQIKKVYDPENRIRHPQSVRLES